MRLVLRTYLPTMMLVATISGVAMLWTHLSHERRGQGPLLAHLWSTHGLHLLDVGALALEVILLLALSIVLLEGLTRTR